MVESQTSDGEWFWDLDRGVAVPAAERGPASNMLGPYPSRSEAENWRQQVEARNDAWDDATDDWNDDQDD